MKRTYETTLANACDDLHARAKIGDEVEKVMLHVRDADGRLATFGFH